MYGKHWSQLLGGGHVDPVQNSRAPFQQLRPIQPRDPNAQSNGGKQKPALWGHGAGHRNGIRNISGRKPSPFELSDSKAGSQIDNGFASLPPMPPQQSPGQLNLQPEAVQDQSPSGLKVSFDNGVDMIPMFKKFIPWV